MGNVPNYYSIFNQPAAEHCLHTQSKDCKGIRCFLTFVNHAFNALNRIFEKEEILHTWNFIEHFDNDGPVFCVQDRKSTRLNSSHANISYAVFCLKKKK